MTYFYAPISNIVVPNSSVSLLLGFSAMLSVSLVSGVTARSLHDICLGVKRHLVSGHEISRLQHGLQLIMARYTRIINCRACCNLYVMYGPNNNSPSRTAGRIKQPVRLQFCKHTEMPWRSEVNLK